MSFQSIFPIILATIAFYVGTYHYFLFSKINNEKREKTFSTLCFFIGIYNILCALLYNSTTIEESFFIQKFQVSSIGIICSLMFFYVDKYFIKVPNFFKSSSIILSIVTIISSFGAGKYFWQPNRPREIDFNFFNIFDYYVIESSPGIVLEILTGVIFVYFAVIYYLCVKELRRAKSKYNIFFMVSITVFLLCFINDGLIGSYHQYEFVYLIEYGFISFIIFSGYLMSLKLVNIEELKKLNMRLQEEISQRKIIEEESEIIQEKMISSSKWITIGEMAGGIAHEINNPLMVIKGNAQLLKKKTQSAELKKYIEKIEKTVDRIYNIVIALKKVSRDSTKDPFQSSKLVEIVNDSISLSQEKLRASNITTEIDCSAELQIECHFTEISQVFLNFINNSIDAVQALDQRWIRITAKESYGFVKLTFTDSGKGIDANTRKKVWEPFFTTKDIGKGTGLGMSISKEIVEAHNGSLFINDLSENTQFVISLPVKQP